MSIWTPGTHFALGGFEGGQSSGLRGFGVQGLGIMGVAFGVDCKT